MPNFTGSITSNGITDDDLVKVLEIKIKHEKSLTFSPQQLQPLTEQRPGQNPQVVHP
jgi:hypothetical protein